MLLPCSPCCPGVCCCGEQKTVTVANASTNNAWCPVLYDRPPTRNLSSSETLLGNWCRVGVDVVGDAPWGSDVTVVKVDFLYPACKDGVEKQDTVRLQVVEGFASWSAVYEKELNGCPSCDDQVEYVFGPGDVISGDGTFCGGNVTWTVKVKGPCNPLP
jgi:hypothetical protein